MSTTMKAPSVMNFLEEEEYDDTGIATAEIEMVKEEAPTTIDDTPLAVKVEARKAVSGVRVTEGNAELIYFLAKFPGATAEALSIISARQDRAAIGHNLLPTVKGTEKKLRKLVSLGAVEAVRNPYTQAVQYTATQLGIDALWSFGYNAEHGTTLDKKSLTRLEHYRNIALVAAQLTSPQGFFRDSLGIEPVALDQLVSENEMRGAYEPVKHQLKEAAKRGSSSDYGRWRKTELEAALSEAGSGKVRWSDIVEAHPALLTLGQPQRTGAKTKAVHQSDLTVILDGARTGTKARNILVEVELSKKSWEEYDSILKTLKMELDHGFIVARVVYFTVGPQVETLLRKVNAKGSYGLFESGKLLVLPILDRNGEPVRSTNRVILGGI